MLNHGRSRCFDHGCDLSLSEQWFSEIRTTSCYQPRGNEGGTSGWEPPPQELLDSLKKDYAQPPEYRPWEQLRPCKRMGPAEDGPGALKGFRDTKVRKIPRFVPGSYGAILFCEYAYPKKATNLRGQPVPQREPVQINRGKEIPFRLAKDRFGHHALRRAFRWGFPAEQFARGGAGDLSG